MNLCSYLDKIHLHSGQEKRFKFTILKIPQVTAQKVKTGREPLAKIPAFPTPSSILNLRVPHASK